MADFIFDRSKWTFGAFYDVTNGRACAIGQFALQNEIAESFKLAVADEFDVLSDAAVNAEVTWERWLDNLDDNWLGRVYDASDRKNENALSDLFAEKDINVIFVGEYPA